MKLATQTKETLFRLGHWHCEVPPCDRHWWDVATWVQWIDARGEWLGSRPQRNFFETN